MDTSSVMRGFEYYWKHWNVVEEWRRMHYTACKAAYKTTKKMKMTTNYSEFFVSKLYFINFLACTFLFFINLFISLSFFLISFPGRSKIS